MLISTAKKLRKTIYSQGIAPYNSTITGNSGPVLEYFISGELTGKERDPETGLYYYGARYLDPRTSRWISADPAMWEGDYIPSAPVNDQARERNQNLPGLGGIYNYVNFHVYHYAGNNPVRLVDPDGRYSGDNDYLASVEAWEEFNRNNPWNVYAIKGGQVIAMTRAGESEYGNSVLIKDSDGITARYAHLESTTLQIGERVSEGQVIGVMGDTGRGLPGPNRHLHVSVYPEAVTGPFNSDQARIINPIDYIKEGTYPANTFISTGFRALIGNPSYEHEGVDFSGNPANMMPNWNRGISGNAGIEANRNRRR